MDMNRYDLMQSIQMGFYCNLMRPNLSCIRMPNSAECLAESISILEDVCQDPVEAIEILEECGL